MPAELRVRYFGDLHLEFTQEEPASVPSIGEDLVVLAGDIANGVDGIRWAQRAFEGRPVVYVLGNHEFYGHDFDQLIVDARAECAGTNVHLLEQDSIDLAGFRILGCTLWTDFQLYGADKASRAATVATGYMADYRAIRRGSDKLTVDDTIDRCRASREWLQKQIQNAEQPLLIVTHHAPSGLTMNPAFYGQLTNAAFHSAFDNLFRAPVRGWMHGHTHYSTSVVIDGIPLLTNQRGYPSEPPGDFSWNRIFELTAT